MPFVRRFALFALPVMLILMATAAPFSGAATLEIGAAAAEPAAPQGPHGTAFTYQGHLNSAGAPVNASCDFEFSLWDDAGAGTQLGATVAPTLAVVDGLFTATLDFGDQFTGDERWLEVALQCPGDPGVTLLSPRVALLGVPYANGLRPGINVTDSASGSSASIASAGAGLAGTSTSGAGVQGSSTDGAGVSGVSAASTGVFGEAQATVQAGVKGTNSAASGIGVRGEANAAGGVGVWGQSNANTGVYGLSTGGRGVWGQSTSTDGVLGVSTSGVGVSGNSTSYYGVDGSTQSANYAGVRGVNLSYGVDGAGVHGVSTNGPGVNGVSTGGTGVRGTSQSSMGVYGISTSDSGVYGQTVASNQPGVKGVNTASSGIGVRGEANAAGGVGVWGQSNANTGVYGLSTSGIGVWGQSTTGPAMRADGNAVQARDKGGWAKAMLYVGLDGQILRCYNGLTGASTNGCGFSVNHFTNGGYGIDFGFKIDDRFILVTPDWIEWNKDARLESPLNGGETVVDVRTYITGEVFATDDCDFFIIVF